MSERYTRLFSLSENLYATGSPVILAAGALSKDNQTEKVFAQLKFKNIQGKDIKAITVELTPFDTVGKPIGHAVSYQYLDLFAPRDVDFGSKTPVVFPNPATRSFSVSVTEVIFSDNAVWTDNGEPWEPLSEPVWASEWLNSLEPDFILAGELEKQYRLRFGNGFKYAYQEEKDLWRCACGAINHNDERLCHACETERTALASFDVNELKAERDTRLAEEKVKAEKQAREKERATKKLVKICGIGAGIAVICAIVILFITRSIIPAIRYNSAEDLLAQKAYYEAALAFGEAKNYRDAKERADSLWNKLTVRESLSAGNYYTVGLKKDGTVVAVGDNDDGQCDVSDWKDIIAISAGDYHTVGLKSDGTVVAVGKNDDGQCDVSGWTDIIAVSAGYLHTVGLKADGTVVAVGSNINGQCDVSDWKDIIAISASTYHTVGLKADGTVVAVGDNDDGMCDVSDWKDIIAISAGVYHTAGLKADGTVVAVGYNEDGQCDVSDLKDIIAISASWRRTLGLKADGTVVAVGWSEYVQCDVSGWTDIIAVSEDSRHAVGLKSDGTVVAAGDNDDGQCDVEDWKDIEVKKN